MLRPDKQVIQAMMRLKTDASWAWNILVEWFNRSYADTTTNHIRDCNNPDFRYRINQGRALELLEICKYLNNPENLLKEVQGLDEEHRHKSIRMETV